MFKNVLVGVDGRANGRDAIALASELVDPDGTLTLVHVHRDETAEREGSHQLLEEERNKAAVNAELVSVAARSPGDGLHQQAQELSADLLVVGCCSHGALGRVLLGDDSRAALDGAPCTVAIATQGYADHVQPRAELQLLGRFGAYDLSGIGRLVDVGGGHGVLMRSVLEAHPHVRGVVFDLGGMIDDTRDCLADAGLIDRCEAIAGDFFEAVPADGDAYVLSRSLHDWDDESAVRILGNCRAAMGGAGRVLAIELVVPADDEPPSSPKVEWLLKTADIEMLAVVGGRERAAAEYRKLYARAGFELTRVLPLEPMAWSVIEGTPA